MRTRKTQSFVDLRGDYTTQAVSVVSRNPNAVPFPSPLPIGKVGSTMETFQACVDRVTPGYFKMSRDSRIHLPVNPLTISKREIMYDGIDLAIKLKYDIDNGGNPQTYTCRRGVWEVKGFPFTLQPHTRHVFDESRMVQSALAKLRSELWDVATFVAEARKTAELVTKAREGSIRRMETILQFLKERWGKYQSGRVTSYKQLLDAFAQLWMEGRFGWRILYYDLLSAQEAYARLAEGLTTLSKRWTVTEDASFENLSGWTPVKIGNTSYPFVYRTRVVRNSVARAGVMGNVDLTAPISLDPIVTAWEVIPFTMVSDWFFNVGEALQAWSPFATGNMQHAFFSQRDVNIQTLEVALDSSFVFQGRPLPQCEGSGLSLEANFILSDEVKTRKAIQPTFDLSWNPNLGNLRWLDGAALAWLLRRRLMAFMRVSKI